MTAEAAKGGVAREAPDDRAREGAAGQGCLLIARASCGRVTRDLDRAFVVPTVDGGSVGGACIVGWMGSLAPYGGLWEVGHLVARQLQFQPLDLNSLPAPSPPATERAMPELPSPPSAQAQDATAPEEGAAPTPATTSEKASDRPSPPDIARSGRSKSGFDLLQPPVGFSTGPGLGGEGLPKVRRG